MVRFRVSILALLLSALTATQSAAAQSSANEPLRGTQSARLSWEFEPGLTCSPAPCVLAPTLASVGASYATFAPVSANPRNPRQLIVGSDDGSCGVFTQLGFYVSSDAGSTWNSTCMKYLSAFGRTYDNGGNPLLGYDLKGSAYIAGYYQYTENLLSWSVIGLEKSTDGVNWSTPISALGNATSQIFYASMAVDQSPSSPYENDIYVLGTNIAGPLQILVSRSPDGGNTWQTSVLAQDPPHYNSWEYNPSLIVGRDGTVYAAWMHCPQVGQLFCTDNTSYMAFSKSSDGGVAWSHPKIVQSVAEVPGPPGSCMCYPFGPIPNTIAGAPNTPALGVDNSAGPYTGRLYAAFFQWTGTYMQVQVIHSGDGGNTWSQPVPVAPPNVTNDQFFPWISVSSTGLVGVGWVDRRNDPANIDYQAFAAISDDGGESFPTNEQLTTAFSNPDTGGGVLGDYAGTAWDGPNYFIFAWMDTSNGINSQDVVGGIRLH